MNDEDVDSDSSEAPFSPSWSSSPPLDVPTRSEVGLVSLLISALYFCGERVAELVNVVK